MATRTLDLSGSWQFRKTPRTSAEPARIAAWHYVAPPKGAAATVEHFMPAKVPGSAHADLTANGRIPDPFAGRNEFNVEWVDHQDWQYRKTFTVDKRLLQLPVVELVAEGLDTLATIRINGSVVARTDSMFREFRFDIRSALKGG